MKLSIEYEKEADTVYLHFSDKPAARSRQLDRERIIDYSEDGEIRGIKFLSVSSGMNTDDLPYRSAIERALADKGFAKLAHKDGTGLFADDVRKDASDSGEALPKTPMKARIAALLRASVATLGFIGFAVISVMLSRNMFVLSSLPGLVASMFGLVVALFPTVIGCFILLAWALDAHSQASRL